MNGNTQSKKRPTGIDCLGSVPWGTHICQFYRSKNDLIDIVVPYFKAALENNEYCLWITSDPLSTDESLVELGKAVPDLRRYLDREQIVVKDSTTLYTRQGKFNAQSTLQGLIETEQFALKHGFDGFRVSGNTSWLTEGEWRDFIDYELAGDVMLRKHRIIGLCSYPVIGRKLPEIVDVVSGHRLVLIREKDRWRLSHNNGNGHLVNLRNSGLSYRDIGRRLGVSKQRIDRVLNHGGKSYDVNIDGELSTRRDRLLSAGDAAEFLSVHINTIRHWSNEGVIPVYRVGKMLHRKFRRTDLEKFLKSKGSGF